MSHGDQPIAALAPRSRFYQGPFGRLFPDLPAWPPEHLTDRQADERFTALAESMIERPGKSPTAIAREAGDTDPTFDSRLPAGYTYLGQFVDHDITFDPASSLVRANDPNGLLNFRTPRLDLDNLYGRGPADQPYLFHRGKFVLARVKDRKGDPVELQGEPKGGPGFLLDVQRNARGVAIIGDPRNDENVIVSQLQVAFLAAHNTLVDRAIDAGASRGAAFNQARDTLRRLYQWIVWHDFLRRVCDRDVWEHALQIGAPDATGRRSVTLGFADVYHWRDQPFMPLEFSAAAYRFGHSMVRTEYRTNFFRGLTKHVPVFAPGDAVDDLRGGRPMTPRNAIQWDWFLPMTSSVAEAGFPQRAHKIDAKVSNALADLPDGAALLPMRNLKRGWRHGLPSGTAVAQRLGVTPIAIDPAKDALWFYILSEAGGAPKGQHLGKVGSIIVAATFAGLLQGDRRSWVSAEPGWKPSDDPLLVRADNVDGRAESPDQPWTLASIIRIAGVPVDAFPFGAIGGLLGE
ncbi:peroxidase family protein [Demequina iriomotensis]|uniref:peroxidase family protein n=1 Tax=Demequina iriomotensis TaxID=1536641 RepID=UPI0007807D34|nr:peroxidase family protein [Demequina iriomotensis]